MSTLSGNVNSTVTIIGDQNPPSPLPPDTYLNPLTVGTGASVTGAAGTAGVFSNYAGVQLNNYGSISSAYAAGASAGPGLDFSAAAGSTTLNAYKGSILGGTGNGAEITNGTLTNRGNITAGEASFTGGAQGGIGVVLDGGTLTNGSGTYTTAVNGTYTRFGEIFGGDVVDVSQSVGGDGVDMSDGATLYNQTSAAAGRAVIEGGSADHSGGVGVAIDGTGTLKTELFNSGEIEGGAEGESDGTGADAVTAKGSNAIVTNTGYIIGGGGADFAPQLGGTGGVGIALSDGASATNTATVKGGYGSFGGVGVTLSDATMTNRGTVIGGGTSYITQLSTGATLSDGSTLTNYGTISYGTGYRGAAQPHSVGFGTGDNTLILESGSSLSQNVFLTGSVTGFADGDVIELAGTTASRSGETVTGADGVTFDFSSTYSGHSILITEVGANAFVTLDTAYTGPPCYVRGTRIQTSRGEVRVEDLALGDRVWTASGGERPVRWLGHRRIRCSAYADPASVWPVRIHAGAFDEQVPRRDLWVSPGHSIAIDGNLIQACHLVNGVTIEQVPCDATEYWHVELDAHDVIYAEGLAAESYLDTGNRNAFMNGGAFVDAFPDFEPKHWAQTCLPLVLEGEAVHRVKATLIGRAQRLGYSISSEAQVHLLADGQRIEPLYLGERRLCFTVPTRCSSLELRCRTFIPAHIDACSADARSLGICVSRLQLDGTDIALNDNAVFGTGWHALEGEPGGRRWRWSQGCVPLPSATRLILIDLYGQGYYWDVPDSQAADAACA